MKEQVKAASIMHASPDAGHSEYLEPANSNITDLLNTSWYGQYVLYDIIGMLHHDYAYRQSRSSFRISYKDLGNHTPRCS